MCAHVRACARVHACMRACVCVRSLQIASLRFVFFQFTSRFPLSSSQVVALCCAKLGVTVQYVTPHILQRGGNSSSGVEVDCDWDAAFVTNPTSILTELRLVTLPKLTTTDAEQNANEGTAASESAAATAAAAGTSVLSEPPVAPIASGSNGANSSMIQLPRTGDYADPLCYLIFSH